MTTRTRSTFLSCCTFLASAALLAYWASSASASTIAAGQLANLRIGDGTTTAAGTALPVQIDIYNVTYTGIVPTSVTLAQTITVPTATSGTAPTSGNRYLTQGGTAGGEGGLALSGDGNYMTLAGYNQIVGGVTNPGTAGTEDRVIGRLELSTGTLDTTTTLTGFSGSTNGAAAIRGAYTANGTDMYAALSVGVRYGTYGTANASTGVAIDGTNNARRNTVFGGQLYQTEAANSRSGVESVGTGTPTTAASATMTLLPGFSTTNTTYSPYDVWFANATTMYISDDSASASTAPGLQKWTFNGSTWSLVFNHSIAAITPGGATAAKGIKSLTGFVDANGNAIMFGSTVGPNANLLVSLVDPAGNTSGAGVTETVVVNASTAFGGTSLWNLRGVALAPGASVPEPSSMVLLLLCGLGFAARRSRGI